MLGSGKKGLPRFLELLLLPWLVLWMFALVMSALHIPSPLLAPFWQPAGSGLLPIKMLGVLLIMAGDAVFVWALISFGSSWRVGIDEKDAGALVTHGIFAFSRNPIFVFIDLYFIGTFLVNTALIFLIFALITIIALHYQILQEEKYLSLKYGQAYHDYCMQTARYIKR